MIKPEYLSSKLTSLMQVNKISNVKLSEDTGIPEITIIKIKKGHNSNPTLATIMTLANYFGVSIDELLTDRVLEVLDMDNADNIVGNMPNVENYFGQIDFAIKVRNDKYINFPKNTILFIKRDYKQLSGGDTCVLMEGNKFILCKVIEIGSTVFGRSLLNKDQYYELNNINNISGVLVGVIWKKN